jgi:signal transduction histidine kinase/putative methionine-R-sulfoxide reductase with GAF domain
LCSGIATADNFAEMLSLPPFSLPPDPDRFQKQLEALKEISRDISSAQEVEAILPLIMNKVARLMRADRSTFFIVDSMRGELWSKVLQSDQAVEIRLGMGEGIAGWVAQSGQLVNLEDAHSDPRFDRTWDDKSGYRTRSLLCMPVLDREMRVIAVLQCLNKKLGRRFNEEDEELLLCIGSQCAIALEGAQLYDELLQRNRALQRAEERLNRANNELEFLYAVEKRITDAPDLTTLAADMLERACITLKLQSGALLVVDEKTADRFVYRSGRKGVSHNMIDVRKARNAITHVRQAEHRERNYEGVLPDLLLLELPHSPLHETFTAPLSDGQDSFGILQLANRRDGAQSEDWILRMLQLLAAQVARGIVNKRERSAAERAERLELLGHSISAILHDLRTPMTAISGYADLMANEDDRDTRLAHVEKVERALSHMETMTHEVLAFARGQREVLLQKVYLQKFVEEVRELLLPETSASEVELVILPEYDGVARFDETKLKRVLFNLARNACQAMGQGGKFTWRISKDGERLVFECTDTGPGIPKEMEGKLFESFASHGKTNGTGLGLAMAKKIVDAHRGSIRCQSQPGEGVTFRIELPL